jgi:hypothetical protein
MTYRSNLESDLLNRSFPAHESRDQEPASASRDRRSAIFSSVGEP